MLADQVMNIDLDLLSKVVADVKGSQGQRYTLIRSTTDYFSYEKHYSVLVDKKVTDSAKKEFEQRLLLAWKQLKPGTHFDILECKA